MEQALSEVNALLSQGASAPQREVLESSPLDDWLRDAGRDAAEIPTAGAATTEPSLDPFIPRRGDGVMLSASDIETYRLCPLKYKFARVFRIPQESTINQRFGIVLHQVLERFHKSPAPSRDELFELFETSWRRGGFGDSDDELQFRERALHALDLYWERVRDQEGEPEWFERSFSFQLGPHLLRGRVDRVDRLPDGSYELIDYKTGKAKTEEDLRQDIQLSVYQMGARESWGVTHLGAELHVRDDRRQGAGRPHRGGAGSRTGHGRADRRGHPAPGVPAHPVAGDLQLLRLPHHLPGGGAVTG